MEDWKKARAEYYREYRKKNRKKIREINERYWKKKCEKLQAEMEGKSEEQVDG